MQQVRMPAPRAAYIHVPFCRHRCGYCNFTLVAGRDDLIERLFASDRIGSSELGARTSDTAATKSIRCISAAARRRILSPDAVAADWLTIALQLASAGHGYEWTVEANPADVDER